MRAFVAELVAICRFFGLFEREAVCCGTVTVPQCAALQALLEVDREIGALAAVLGTTASATTRLVDGLERRGWTERVRSTEDRRRVAITLTKEGRDEARRLATLTERSVEAVYGRIPRAKRAQVVESLRLLREAIEASRRELGECCAPPGDPPRV